MSRHAEKELTDVIASLLSPLTPVATEMEEKLCAMDDVRAVVLDVYGTMVISASGDIGLAASKMNHKTFQKVVHALGVRLTSFQAKELCFHFYEAIRQRHAAGRSEGCAYPEVDIVDVWRDAIDQAGLAAIIDTDGTAAMRRMAVEFEMRTNPVWPMPGVMDAVQQLLDKNKILGIVSNAQFYTPLMLEVLLGRSVCALGFDAADCVWSYVEGEAKPSEKLFAKLLTAMMARGIKASQVVYVGNDMLNDMYTARKSGCRTILFAGDARSLRLREEDERCCGWSPDAIVTTWQSIGKVIM